MKITKEVLKRLISEEIAAVVEAAAEEHTPMMPPKPVKIDPRDMFGVAEAVRKFAAEFPKGDPQDKRRDILEKAAEILHMESGVFE